MMLTVQLSGQPRADCSIDIPQLGTPEQIGEPTIFYYSTTGTDVHCDHEITNPNWTVTGNAQIGTGANENVVRVEATGDFQLGLQYTNSFSGDTEISTLQTASNIRINPAIVLDCGLDIILVLDESNSISNNEEDDVRQSVRSLLNRFKNSGSRMAIVEYGTRAVAEEFDCSVDGSSNYMDISTENINGCINTYLEEDYGDPAPYSGGTNWDDALLKVLDIIENNTIQPDLVLFITDGNPTYYIDENNNDILGGTGASSKVSALNHALVRANAIKEHSRIFGVGIGTRINEQNLKFITGIVPFEGDLSGSDYMISSDFNELGNDLNDIANALCGTNMSIIQEGPACVSSSGASVAINITIKNTGGESASNVEVSEILPPGFLFDHEVLSPDIGSVYASGNLRRWDMGSIEAGSQATWTIHGSLPSGSPDHEFTAMITSDNNVVGSDDTAQLVIGTGGILLSETHTDNSCAGLSEALIDLSVSGGVPPYEYFWSNGSTSEDLEDLISGDYSVEVLDANGCHGTLEVHIDQADQVPVYVHVTASNDWICGNETSYLEGPVGFSQHQWYHNGEEIVGAQSNSYQATEPGAYSLYVEDDELCASGISEALILNSDAVITSPDTLFIDMSEDVFMDVCLESVLELNTDTALDIWVSSQPDHVSFSLNPNAHCAELEKQDDLFEQDWMTVIACDLTQCLNCDTTYIQINNYVDSDEPESDQDMNCFIANVITPNGDGLNDHFYIDCLDNWEQVTLMVFNRWGNQVYYNDIYNNDWNGTYKGMPLPFGTYYYTLKFVNPRNEHMNLGGDMTIIY